MKTTVFNSLKHYTFLLLAVLISFVGIAQTTQSHVVINSIGGSKTPPYVDSIQLLSNVFLPKNCCNIDLGWRNEICKIPFRNIANESYSLAGISPNATASDFSFSDEIGGRGAGVGTGQRSINICFMSVLDIGGRNTGGEFVFEIGGRSQEPLLFTIISDYGSIPYSVHSFG
jgi:hypothetical protein